MVFCRKKRAKAVPVVGSADSVRDRVVPDGTGIILSVFRNLAIQTIPVY